MDATAKRQDSEISVSAIARECLEAANGDVRTATIILLNRCDKDLQLYKTIAGPLMRTACYEEIRKVCRKDRRAIWHMPQPTAQEQRGRVIALNNTLMDFRLPDGTRLGDAKHSNIMAASEFYRKQGRDMTVKAVWLEMIAKKVDAKDRKTASQCVSVEELDKLRQKAEGSA